jgi:hypothetical protein
MGFITLADKATALLQVISPLSLASLASLA